MCHAGTTSCVFSCLRAGVSGFFGCTGRQISFDNGSLLEWRLVTPSNPLPRHSRQHRKTVAVGCGTPHPPERSQGNAIPIWEVDPAGTVSATCDNPLSFHHRPHATPTRGYYSPAAWESSRWPRKTRACLPTPGETRDAADQWGRRQVAAPCASSSRPRAPDPSASGTVSTQRRTAATAGGDSGCTGRAEHACSSRWAPPTTWSGEPRARRASGHVRQTGCGRYHCHGAPNRGDGMPSGSGRAGRKARACRRRCWRNPPRRRSGMP